MTRTLSQTFLEKGYVILPAENRQPLLTLKEAIFAQCQQVFDHAGDNADAFFDHFHTLQSAGADLNQQRQTLIQQSNAHIDINRAIFNAFPKAIQTLLGPDLLVQKNVNLVISPPQDPNNAELHRDAPTNSLYEVVIWIPLVDCFKSKTVYVLDVNQSDAIFQSLGDEQQNWPELVKTAEREGTPATVPFGSALFFWAGLFHGSKQNQEETTRWTLNTRFKSAFAPAGQKDPYSFYDVFQLSAVTRLALDAEKRELM